MAAALTDEEFVRSVTAPAPTPFVPEILLHQADDAIALWEQTEERAGVTGLAPPFWAFAWAGGQALARYVLDHPDVVAGRRVLDLAAGSGLVAVAAAHAGARHVVANEIDPLAVAAIRANAALNAADVVVHLGDLVSVSSPPTDFFDVVLAGDVFYDRSMAALFWPFLLGQARAGAVVLVGDPGRAYLPTSGLSEVARYAVPVLRTLEDRDVRSTGVLKVLPGTTPHPR